jgi:transposase
MLKRHAIQVLRKAGHVQRDVAGAAGVSIDTVRRVERETAVTDVDAASARAARRIGRPSTAAPFRPFVEEVLAKEPDLMSLEVLRRARLRGYGGGKSALYEVIASIRPRPVRPLVRFEGVPGEFSQHDFGQVDVRFLSGRGERVHFFASRLKYSRWPEVTLVPNQQVETLARTLVGHFAAMGGVPLAAVFDRPTTIALAWKRDGEVVEWNPTFAQVMLELGVAVELCWPARGQQKGSVENLVGWVKGSFFKQRRFLDDEDLRQQLAEWHLEVQTRIPCRATGVIPTERMVEERRRLRPLKVTPETLALRIPIWVGPTGMVLHDTHLYSMPPDAIGIAGTLFLYRDRVRIIAGRFAATHPRLTEPGAKSTLPEHRAAMVAAVSGKRGQRYLKRQHLLDLGSSALAYLTEVIHRRPRHWLGEVDQLHALLQRVGTDPLRAAFTHAVAADTVGVEYIEHHLRAAGALNGAAPPIRDKHPRGRSSRASDRERALAGTAAPARGPAEVRRP